jgi:hypothetical protein
MLHVPGAGQTLDEMNGRASRGDRIANEGGFGVPDYRRMQDSPFEVMQLNGGLMNTPPPVNSNSLGRGTTHTAVLDDSTINFQIKVDYFFQSDGKAIAAFTIQTDNSELHFQDSGGLQVASVNISGKISNVTERKIGAFEDVVSARATAGELVDAKERKSIYSKAVLLSPGTYRLDLMLRDVNTGAFGFQRYGFTLPKFDRAKLSTSTLVLAAKLENSPDGLAVGPFMIGRTKVVPNISGVYHRGAPVGIYMQVYNAGTDQTTLRPAIDVDYTLLKDGKEISREVEDWTGMSEAGPRLTLARLIDTRNLTPGEYEIQIRIRDHVTGQTLSPTTKFKVAP